MQEAWKKSNLGYMEQRNDKLIILCPSWGHGGRAETQAYLQELAWLCYLDPLT